MEDDYEEVIIDTKDINLRPFNTKDIDDFMVWAADDMVTRYVPWSTYTSKENGLNFIENVAIPHPYCRAICWKKRAIGSISVTPNEGDIDKCRAQLGYVLASKYWGKGIATKAVSIAVSMAFSKWVELERIEAIVHVDNVASQRVLDKVGFIREGVLRKYIRMKEETINVVMFSLLSNDLDKIQSCLSK